MISRGDQRRNYESGDKVKNFGYPRILGENDHFSRFRCGERQRTRALGAPWSGITNFVNIGNGDDTRLITP